MRGKEPEFFSPFASDIYMEVAGKVVLEKNGRTLSQKNWAKGAYPDYGKVIKGSTGEETVFIAHNISPYNSDHMPPVWVVPIAVSDTENNRTLWIKGHLPIAGERITGDSGPETVVYQQRYNTPKGPSFKTISHAS